MGVYINKNLDGSNLSLTNKLQELIQSGGKLISENELKTLQYEPNVLICIVDNIHFQAVAFIYDKEEFDRLYNYKNKYNDERPYYWLRHPKAKDLSIL